ncbi:MAG: septum site-determining protein Ssd [Candidatus Nanopelagicales bacterium]|jgi:secretion/DNA translocation related CpaE-like protein|nr:hypothetical protein [Actinomycetes bacterium]MCH9831609.1 hypothetical protein [Actinomycetes bacterium]MCH9840375.1 hypothetical protein [Actinomycetes bacterium]
MSQSPEVLLITLNHEVINYVSEVVDPLGIQLQVVGSPLVSRETWEAAPFVLVGSDLAGVCVENRVPRRAHLVVVHAQLESESEKQSGVEQGSASERDIWRHAVALGAENVLELPNANFWLADALSEFAVRESISGAAISNVISVVGGSGGAGASTFAVTLAAAAVAQGLTSVLVDLDQFGGGIDLILGAEEVSGTRWPDIDSGAGRIAGETLSTALPRSNGVAFLSQSRTAPSELGIEVVAAVVDAAKRAFDVVILDLPRGASGCNELLLGQSFMTCIVARNHVRPIAASIALAQWVKRIGSEVRYVLISDSKGLGLPDVCGALGNPNLTEIAFMPAMTTRADEGDPPGTNSGYRDVCRALLGELFKKSAKKVA